MIRETKTYILRLMSGMLMLLLLLTACSSDDDMQNDNPVLKIYVYSPDHPIQAWRSASFQRIWSRLPVCGEPFWAMVSDTL